VFDRLWFSLLARPYLLSAGAVLAVFGAVVEVALALEHALGSHRWVSSDLVEHAVLAGGALTFAGLSLHVLFLFGRPVGPKTSRMPISLDRLRRLHKALDFLPEPLPESWSPALSPHGTVLWRVIVGGDVVLLAWVVCYNVGDRLHVTLAHEREARAVDDTRAAEILAHFRGVTSFAEQAKTLRPILEKLPGARTWLALPFETVRSMPVPSAPPELTTTPLNAHLAAVRRHLPSKLPEGWSVPLAITEQRFGWRHGAWMIEHEDVISIVMMFVSGGRPKLSVTLFRPDQSEVGEYDALDILKHFRGVREFVQTEMTDPEQIAGARSYVSEVDLHPTTTILN
jgi:hypothetical protein